jgi:formate/nitrite transporter FocA (FNT family)
MSFKEKVNMGDVSDATVMRGASMSDTTSILGYYTVECHDADGNLKWKDDINNLVTTIGKNRTMDVILGNTAGGAIFMGLKGTGTAAVGDTQASHAGWLEVGLANAPTFTAPRPTPAFSAASAGAKTTSSAVVFAMTGSGTVAGCFINIGGTSTIDNTTGTLFSAGDFTAGSKTVTGGDLLSVTYTATAA